MPDRLRVRLQPVPSADVSMEDGFWAPRIETNRAVTLPLLYERNRKTGALKGALTVGYVRGRKNGQAPRFEVYPKRMSGKNKYPWVNLHGVRGKTVTQKTRRGSGNTLVLGYRTFTMNIPARPWAAWTPKDVKQVIREFQKWFAATF